MFDIRLIDTSIGADMAKPMANDNDAWLGSHDSVAFIENQLREPPIFARFLSQRSSGCANFDVSQMH